MTHLPQKNSSHQENPFATQLLAWYAQHGRHNLPWQVQDPYMVWVSEVMLQQTQVKTVLGYFERFMQRFPNVAALANAEWDDVATLWAGLGYYARARNLHRAAKTIHTEGQFPTTLAGWQALSGIGASTAGAIMAMGQGQYGVILDGNVKRVLTRYFAIADDISKAATTKQLWQLAETLTPTTNTRAYTQAIMDLGATLCTRSKPACPTCPVKQRCQSHAQGNPSDYPVKRKKQPIPSKAATVLVLEYKNTWLWLQRPQHGLWGGLWCLPILNHQADPQNEITQDKENNQTLSPFDAMTQRLYDTLANSQTNQQQKPQSQENQAQEKLAQKKQPQHMTAIKHTFTHFHWLLTPSLYLLTQKEYININVLLDENNLPHQWLTAAKPPNVGIPKAMHKVVDKVANSSTTHSKS